MIKNPPKCRPNPAFKPIRQLYEPPNYICITNEFMHLLKFWYKSNETRIKFYVRDKFSQYFEKWKIIFLFCTLTREGVCSPGHFLKGAESNFLENQINWYYAWVLVTYLFIHFT